MDLKYQLLKVASVPKGQVGGRYAPSPSGIQHLGNIRTAMAAWLQARLSGGFFALRMDDIDTPRVKAGSAAQIIEDLHFLGMDWDVIEASAYRPDAHKIYTETDFISFYDAAFERLSAQGMIYPCACSRRDIRRQVAKPNAAGHYIYPGTCRHKTSKDFRPDEQIVWRFKAPSQMIEFTDRLAAEQAQNVAGAWGDIIVKRFNGLYAYQFVSVVDDIQMGISDVVRGMDLLDSTAGQITLFEALGARVPRFWHLPLKTNTQGEKLAKRDGSDSMQRLRKAGATAEQIIGQLAHELALSHSDAPISLNELLAQLQSDLRVFTP